MKVALIVAMDLERGIGKNNDLMWHLPADMKFFKETTTGHIVVLGRKNYESIPEKFRPLPNRVNAVLTRNAEYKADGSLVFHSLESCLDYFKDEKEKTIFIIGGGEIYKQALDLNCVEIIYLTEVQKVYGADTFFPKIDLSNWDKEILFQQKVDEKHEAAFTITKYQKK